MLDRFRQSAPQVQMAWVAALIAVLAGALALVWFLAVRVEYRPIFTKLRTADAAAIVAELDRRKIPYRLGDSGTTISVAEDRADAVRLSLSKADLALKDSVGFELFNKSDMGITDFAQKINYQRALQGELERTIAALDGVETARVHLSMGDDRLFRQDRIAPKASVSLRMLNGAMVPPATVAGLQQLIAAAVPQLDPDAVVVLDEGGQVLSTPAMATAPEAQLSPQMQEKRAVEAHYAAQIRTALDEAFGVDGITVGVWIDGDALPADTGDDGRRRFRMQISLTPTATLSREAQESARATVAQLIGYDATLGDVILFGGTTPVVAGPQVRQRVVRAADGGGAFDNAARQPEGGSVVLPVLGGLVLSVGLVLLVLRRRNRVLDEGSRLAFAERLKILLDEEADSGSRPA